MDWKLEDDIVDGLLFFATLTNRRGSHTPVGQAGVETSDTGAEAVEPDPCFFWQGHPRRVGAGVGDKSTESRVVVRPLRIPFGDSVVTVS